MSSEELKTIHFLEAPASKWCDPIGRYAVHEKHYRIAFDLVEEPAKQLAIISELATYLKQDKFRLAMLIGREETHDLEAKRTYYLIFDLQNNHGMLLILEHATTVDTLPPFLEGFHKDLYFGKVMDLFWQDLNYKVFDQYPEYAFVIHDEHVQFSVGPIHAGIIQPAQFQFDYSGEEISSMNIELDYTCKGIVQQFAQKSLCEGAILSNFIASDHAFAYSLAFCQAVESMAYIQISDNSKLLRVVFLELERIHNHLNTLAGIVDDAGYYVWASPFSYLEEVVRQLCAEIGNGDRLLRNLNIIGGVLISLAANQIEKLQNQINKIEADIFVLSEQLYNTDRFRNRLAECGTIKHQANNRHQTFATGLIRRGMGRETQLRPNYRPAYTLDFRLRYPVVFSSSQINELFTSELKKIFDSPYPFADGQPKTTQYIYKGDVLSRFMIRIEEIVISCKLISMITKQWPQELNDPCRISDKEINIRLWEAPAFSFGLSGVESTVGDILCWIMKDSTDNILHCQMRSPSLLNWEELKSAMTGSASQLPDKEQGIPVFFENILADFPLVNKSFDLSYSGRDM